MTSTYLFDELQFAAPHATLFDGGGVDGYEVAGLRPSAVVRPRDQHEISAVLRLATRLGLAVTVRGGGTMIDQGRPPRRLDLVLDLSQMNRVVEHAPRDWTVTVETGITVAALQAQLARSGQMLALDPPLPSRATVGGVLAANAWGSRRQRSGTARDLLLGCRAVLADGTVFKSGGKVVKNVAGYDLNKLLIGSFGTLAVITQATFRLAPLPQTRALFRATLPTSEAAHRLGGEVARSSLGPLTLDVLSPALSTSLLGDGAPESTAGWALMCEVAGGTSAVDRSLRDLHRLASEHSGDPRTIWANGATDIVDAISEFGAATPGTLLAVRLSVLPAQTGAAVRALRVVADPAILSRPGLGSVTACWREPIRGAVNLAAAVRAVATGLGGSLVVERAPLAALAQIDPWGLDGADVDLMRRVKQSFDPAGVLSPGRLP